MAGENKRGRKPNVEKTQKITPALSAEVIRCLRLLSDSGRYGSTPNEVARYLITRAIDDLTRGGVLPGIPGDQDRSGIM